MELLQNWGEWQIHLRAVLPFIREKPNEVQQGPVQGPAPGEKNPKSQHRLGCDPLESSSAEKDLGVLLDDKLPMSQQSPCGQEGQWDPGVLWE